MFFGICIGFLLGALVVNIYLKESERTNIVLKRTIKNLKDDLDLTNSKVKNRDLIINDYQEEHIILLNNTAELKEKVIDLENNIELLVNNLTDKNKELANYSYRNQEL